MQVNKTFEFESEPQEENLINGLNFHITNQHVESNKVNGLNIVITKSMRRVLF